jgi:hypothetical protein
MHTPFFSAFRAQLGPMKAKRRLVNTRCVHQLQIFFEKIFPPHRLSPADEGKNSRKRHFFQDVTFWMFLWQVLNVGSSCRDALLQRQSRLTAKGLALPKTGTSAYCQARARLDWEAIHSIFKDTIKRANELCHQSMLWLGHQVFVIDGSTVLMPDTPKNQKAYPQPSFQKRGCAFPMMRLVVLFSLATGTVVQTVTGTFIQSELNLFRSIMNQLPSGSILLGDRGWSDYVTAAVLQASNVFVVMRQNVKRPKDFRKGRRLGPNDRLIKWTKPARKPKTISQEDWEALPDFIHARMIRFQAKVRGRQQTIITITTLLDPKKYPVEAIAQLVKHRWKIELTLRDLKTTMKMEMLRCRSPKMVEKELQMHLIAYNFIRCLMLEAALKHDVPADRLSFKGSVDTVRNFSSTVAQAKTIKERAAAVAVVLELISKDVLPDRPDRHEPRAVKRRRKPYSMLNGHRKIYKEPPKRRGNRTKKARKNRVLN